MESYRTFKMDVNKSPEVKHDLVVARYFVNRQYKSIKNSSLFDTDYYLEHNPDVVESGVNPLAHY